MSGVHNIHKKLEILFKKEQTKCDHSYEGI